VLETTHDSSSFNVILRTYNAFFLLLSIHVLMHVFCSLLTRGSDSFLHALLQHVDVQHAFIFVHLCSRDPHTASTTVVHHRVVSFAVF